MPFESIMFRAEVVDQIDEDKFCVSFIDYGNKEDVHVDQIFEISDELKMVNTILLFYFLQLK